MAERRQVAIVALANAHDRDLLRLLAVFHAADELITREQLTAPGYRVSIFACNPAALPICGARATAPDHVPAATLNTLDTVIVVADEHRLGAVEAEPPVRWLARVSELSRRVACVGDGAFTLAEAGLLNGRHIAISRARAAAFATHHPAVDVHCEPMCVRDGPIWSSGDLSSGADLALLMVEDDLGRAATLLVARQIAANHGAIEAADGFAAAWQRWNSDRGAASHTTAHRLGSVGVEGS